MAAVYSRVLGVKIIFYTQTEINKSVSILKNLQTRLILFIFDAAWYSPLRREKPIDDKSVKRPIFYVPFAVPKGDLKQQDSQRVKVLMIGKYHQARKNHHLFLDALAQLKDKYSFKGTIVGECITREQIEKFSILKEKVNELELLENVELKKNINHSDMSEIYSSHDIFVLPSSNEPASISVLEALAFGLPVICSDSCGTQSYISSGQNGYVFKTNNLFDLVQKIETLISNPKKVSEMREYCNSNYEKTISGNAYYEHLEYLLKKKWGMLL
jgi:glycosyltransferase involved in cell wall biosynthesis